MIKSEKFINNFRNLLVFLDQMTRRQKTKKNKSPGIYKPMIHHSCIFNHEIFLFLHNL